MGGEVCGVVQRSDWPGGIRKSEHGFDRAIFKLEFTARNREITIIIIIKVEIISILCDFT